MLPAFSAGERVRTRADRAGVDHDSAVARLAHLDPSKSLVPGALIVWQAVVMTIPATRFLAITVISPTVLGGCGEHRTVFIGGNQGG